MFVIVAKPNRALCPKCISIQAKIEQRWHLLQTTGARPHSDAHAEDWVLPLLSAATDFQSQPGWSFLILYTEKKLLSQLRTRPAERWGGGLIRSLPWGCDLLTFTLLAKPGVAGLFRRTSLPQRL